MIVLETAETIQKLKDVSIVRNTNLNQQYNYGND